MRISPIGTKIFRTDSFRAIGLLTGSAFVAQLLPLVVLPLLTRLYSPADYGILALFAALSMTLAPLATSSLEQAVPLPKRDSHAALLIAAALLWMAIVGIVLLVIIVAWHQTLIDAFDLQKISAVIYAVPLGIGSIGAYQLFSYWLIRRGAYRAVACNKLVQAGSTAALSVALGLVSLRAGLIIGLAGGYGLGALVAYRQSRRHGLVLPAALNLRFYAIIRRHRHFLIYGGIPCILNTAASMLPAILINRFYSAEIAGLYVLARQIIGAPTAMVAQAAGQVVLRTVAADEHTGKSYSCEMRMLFFYLLALGFAMSLFLWTAGPVLFHFLFGARWYAAGRYAGMLSIAAIFWLAVSPMGNVLVARHRIQWVAVWQCGYFAATCVLIFLSHLAFTQFLASLVAIDVLSYSLYLFIIALFGQPSAGVFNRSAG
jgi:O-antigen/teichoic acid export membrane protein